MPAVTAPSAEAAPCADAEVIFARGTTELPGVGPTGQAFVDSLRSHVAPKSVEVYGVDYPATTDFPTAVQGIADARERVITTAANCPDTKMVLGGFSQGAAVIGFLTSSVVPDGVSPLDVPAPMPAEVADHVAAVALFGTPSPRFMKVLNDPPVTVGPNYVAKAIDLCVDNDLVCDPTGRSFAVHNQYEQAGMVDKGAGFVAQKLQAGWAAEERDPDRPAPPTQPQPTQPPPTFSPVSGPAATPPVQHIGATPDTAPGPTPLPGPAAPPSAAPVAPLA
ncbi:cutinase family protein [Mycobacterium sp. 21AC1]|uniref:cutinase family protein n=1 Tax=[Mycobacterium] appelbergii TaxID=2939269 RepID=UPI002938DDD9|nr:cutinase family protein [Mycobacterium sp. 21AC1]MDV3125411.1 cutinase family protein [Mycobacterium sp. 21AC1]